MFGFEICLPVDVDVAAQGRVQPGEIRAARVTRTTSGNYDQLGAEWGEFMGGVRAQDLPMAGDFREVYAVGPSDSDNPADWRTPLNVPLKD